MSKTKSISLINFFWFFVQAQIGVGLFTLPYSVYNEALSDGWISVLLAGIGCQIMIVLLWATSKQFPNLTFYEYQKKVLGTILGKTMIFFYSCYFIILAISLLVIFNMLINVWVLPNTPNIIKIPLFMIASLYLLNSSLRVLGNFMTLTSPILFLAPLCALYAFIDPEPLYLLPILKKEATNIWSGVLSSSFAMQGFLIFPILYPYINGTNKEKLLTATYANVFVTVFYTFIVIACFVYFSPGQFVFLPEPFLYMIKTVSLIIVERVDLIFLAFWFIIVLSTLTILLYCATNGLETFFDKYKTKLYSLITGSIVATLSLIPRNLLLMERLFHYAEYIGILFVILLPIILFLYVNIIKKNLEKSDSD